MVIIRMMMNMMAIMNTMMNMMLKMMMTIDDIIALFVRFKCAVRPGWRCTGFVVMIVMITAGDAEDAWVMLSIRMMMMMMNMMKNMMINMMMMNMMMKMVMVMMNT